MIEYTLVRSAKRRTISITIERDGTVTARCGMRTPKSEVDAFVIKKSGWITSKLNQIDMRSKLLDDVYAYKKILVCGKKVDFSFGSPEKFGENGVRCASFRRLKELYVKNLGAEFIAMFKEIAKSNGLKYSSVGFKNYKSRWGCCFADGKIYFNYKLLMLDRNYWRAVASHELCHTLYMDHSKNFHTALLWVMPDYLAVNKAMSAYSAICSMY